MPSCHVCGVSLKTSNSLKKHLLRQKSCVAPTALINSILVNVGVTVPEESTREFRSSSLEFNKSLTKEIRTEQGIFFTPKKVRDVLFAKLAEFAVKPTTILEPAFGTGEFILDAKRIFPTATIEGVEKNKQLCESVKCIGVQLKCADFFDYAGKADLIIGNPPYFNYETKSMSKEEKKAFQLKYANAFTSRANIYVMFLYKCIAEHLNDGGFLAFIVPTSLYNTSFYQPMRDYIHAHTAIRWVETLHKPGFYETAQETMLLILEKKTPTEDFIYRNTCNYISPLSTKLYELTKDTTTIGELGLGVKTGSVVWNEVKDKLASEGTLLIYASNIAGCELKLNNLRGDIKKQYVKDIKKPTQDGPVILMDRGYGNGLHFNFVLVNEKGFFAENHINIVYAKTPDAVGNFERVLQSLKDPRTMEFLKAFSGNGMVTSTDIETIIPIFPYRAISTP